MEMLRVVEELEFNETEFAKAEASHALTHEVHQDLDSRKRKVMARTARFGHQGNRKGTTATNRRIMPANKRRTSGSKGKKRN